MIRILLPLAVIAAILFAPMFSETVTGSEFGERTDQLTGWDYVGDTVNCFRGGEFSIADECAPKGGAKGTAIFAAVFISAIAAVLGVLGLLPFVGRITSVITTAAGVVVIAAIAYYALAQTGTDEGVGGIQWGTFLAGGGGLLTLISGLSGMRGR